MVKKNLECLVLLIIILLIIPTIFALDTQINIKTLPSHKISVIVRAAGELPTLQSFHKDTGNGNFSVKTSSSKTSLDLLIILTKDKINVLNEKFEGIEAGKPVYLKIFPGNVEKVDSFEEKTNATAEANSTPENSSVAQEAALPPSSLENETVEEPTQNETAQGIEQEKTGITGAVVNTGKTIFSSKIFYYILGIIFILSAIFFFVVVFRKKIKAKKNTYLNFKIRSGKEDEVVTKSNPAYDKKIIQIEKKIEDAKKELDEIAGKKKKISEARKRFEEAKKELEKLEND